jgi:hypothetical protein
MTMNSFNRSLNHAPRSNGLLAAALLAAMAIGSISPAVAAGSTPWFSRDLPSATGDFEMTQLLLTIECRLKGTNTSVTSAMPGYHCEIPKGGWCVNSAAKGGCKDIEVMYRWNAGKGPSGTSWTAGATPWLDRDNPSATGDYEMTNLLLKVACRYVDGHGAVTTGGSYNCNSPMGGWCTNVAANAGKPAVICRDIEVQFSWQ